MLNSDKGIVPLELTRSIVALVTPDPSSDIVNQETEKICTITYKIKGFETAVLSVVYKCGFTYKVRVSSRSDKSNYICEFDKAVSDQLNEYAVSVVGKIIKNIGEKLCP